MGHSLPPSSFPLLATNKWFKLSSHHTAAADAWERGSASTMTNTLSVDGYGKRGRAHGMYHTYTERTILKSWMQTKLDATTAWLCSTRSPGALSSVPEIPEIFSTEIFSISNCLINIWTLLQNALLYQLPIDHFDYLEYKCSIYPPTQILHHVFNDMVITWEWIVD